MRPFLLFLCLLAAPLNASDASRQQYLELISRHPAAASPQGVAANGEIEIILDPHKMAVIEKRTGRDVGVVAQDNYWIWLNDACLFPNGKEGVYGRILWVKSLESTPGVAVMPIMPDGTIVLNCNFRHATRTWEIELPRGGINKDESIEAAARRETVEETGMVIDSLYLLGELPPDTGISNTVVPIFAAKVVKQETPEREDSEAIEEILTLSPDTIKKAFVKGYHTCKIRGVETPVYFRDPFLAYALLLYELRSVKPENTSYFKVNIPHFRR